MPTIKSKLLLICFLSLLSFKILISQALAEEISKSDFNLFNPTPEALLRDLSTDRPDKTESPYTVDAGYWQLEFDVINVSQDKTNESRVRSWNVAPFNIKLGLLNNLDIQLLFGSYSEERTRDRESGMRETKSGVGDLTTRMKFNLWGNDGGSSAAALMPFIKSPTNTNDLGNNAVEGGLIVPFAFELTEVWSLGVMTELDVLRNQDNRGNHIAYINTITFSRPITSALGAYVEYFTEVDTEGDNEFVATLDLGCTFGLNPNVQFDAGLNIGVTDSAEDLNPFVGMSYRFG